MSFYAYIYDDPKTGVPRYVGKGLGSRAKTHLKYGSSNPRFNNMIKKRVDEGFDVVPTIIHAPSELAAFAIERFWIAVIGRENLGTGSLFNLTDGGEGATGYKRTPEITAKIQATMMVVNQRPDVHQRRSEACRKHRQKKCTVDGVRIFESRSALIAALGQGVRGLLSPTFRYV